MSKSLYSAMVDYEWKSPDKKPSYGYDYTHIEELLKHADDATRTQILKQITSNQLIKPKKIKEIPAKPPKYNVGDIIAVPTEVSDRYKLKLPLSQHWDEIQYCFRFLRIKKIHTSREFDGNAFYHIYRYSGNLVIPYTNDHQSWRKRIQNNSSMCSPFDLEKKNGCQKITTLEDLRFLLRNHPNTNIFV